MNTTDHLEHRDKTYMSDAQRIAVAGFMLLAISLIMAVSAIYAAIMLSVAMAGWLMVLALVTAVQGTYNMCRVHIERRYVRHYASATAAWRTRYRELTQRMTKARMAVFPEEQALASGKREISDVAADILAMAEEASKSSSSRRVP
ncbi:MAG: hypothetical protein FGM24_04475 [Candidatus Kapabacteria bacterium]|nr:hypothetical protein [Candidatus Kapabacteria bacterium]